MATSAERMAKMRAHARERERVIAAAKSFVPGEGERQDRAVAHALEHLEGWEAGEHANPYPQALEPSTSRTP